jgi:hypothetical protein
MLRKEHVGGSGSGTGKCKRAFWLMPMGTKPKQNKKGREWTLPVVLASRDAVVLSGANPGISVWLKMRGVQDGRASEKPSSIVTGYSISS